MKKTKGKGKTMTTNLPLIEELIVHGRDIYPLVIRQASKKWNGQGRLGSIEYQDLIGEALLAVVQLQKRFKPGNVKFTTYAYQRIGGAAHDLIRRELTYGTRFDPTPINDLIREAGGADGMEEKIARRGMFLKVIDIIENHLEPLLGAILIRTVMEGGSDKEAAKDFRIGVEHLPALRERAIQEVRRFLFMPALDYQDGR